MLNCSFIEQAYVNHNDTMIMLFYFPLLFLSEETKIKFQDFTVGALSNRN